MFNGKVLVATDGSPLSERAVETAAELAQKVGAVLTAVTVVEPYPYSGVGESSAVAGSDYQSRVGAEASARLARAKELAEQERSRLPHIDAGGIRSAPGNTDSGAAGRRGAHRDGLERTARSNRAAPGVGNPACPCRQCRAGAYRALSH